MLSVAKAEEVRLVLRADPERLERSPGPVLLDEWQREPSVWDALRRSVDRAPDPARFLGPRG